MASQPSRPRRLRSLKKSTTFDQSCCDDRSMESYSHTDASYQARGASSPHVPLVASVELATGWARVALVDLDSEGLDCLL
jgi:hypothetical protein